MGKSKSFEFLLVKINLIFQPDDFLKELIPHVASCSPIRTSKRAWPMGYPVGMGCLMGSTHEWATPFNVGMTTWTPLYNHFSGSFFKNYFYLFCSSKFESVRVSRFSENSQNFSQYVNPEKNQWFSTDCQ